MLSTSKPLDVHVLQENRVYTYYLRTLLLTILGPCHISCSQSLHETTESLKNKPVDLFITSSNFPDGDIFEILERLRSTQRSPRIFFIASQRGGHVIKLLRLLRIEGAFDLASEGPEELTRALELVASGASYWSGSLLGGLKEVGALPSIQQLLTPTEQLVFAILGDGCDDIDAGSKLDMQPSTVQSVRKRLHRKLSAQHKGDLVRLAVQYGLVRFTPKGVIRPGIKMLAASSSPHLSKRKSNCSANYFSAGLGRREIEPDFDARLPLL